MRASRVIALVVGCLVALPALALLLSGGILAVAYAAQRDDGYFDVTLDQVDSSTAAITAERIDLRSEPGTPRWVVDALDTDVRLRVTGAEGGQPIFVGIARERELDRYLDNVAHDEIRDVDDLEAEFRRRSGADVAPPPTDQDFWEASTTGTGTQELEWEAQSGRWAVALMNADGSPGVTADVNVGVRSDLFVPIAILLLVLGIAAAVVAASLIVFGGIGLGAESPRPPGQPPSMAGAAPTGAEEPAVGPQPGSAPYPLTLEADLDPGLTRWMWLVKWILAIPHLIILFLLWIAFALLTVVAGVAILFTTRYPRAIFDFNVGVLRWSWRVSYYAFSGGLGTDRYPPFSLGEEPDYPATLSVEYPEQLNRWLVLVKWWLLAIPHYLIVGVIAGGGFRWEGEAGWSAGWGPAGGGLVGILTLVAAVILLFTSRYPTSLFDLIVGLNRWVYRVTAYVSLMTDRYPPFRLDQGGSEPARPGPTGPLPPADEVIALEPELETAGAPGPTEPAEPMPVT